jgi:hypothetical protein
MEVKSDATDVFVDGELAIMFRKRKPSSAKPQMFGAVFLSYLDQSPYRHP